MKNNRIWIISELFYPEETSVAYIFTRIANFLSSDYDVSVICGPELYDINKAGFKDNFKTSEKIIVYRSKTFFNYDKNSLLQRALRTLSLSVKMSLLVIKKVERDDVVLISTQPVIFLLIISILKYWKKIQLHILVHDVFPENTIPAKIFKNNKSFIYKILKLIFDKAYSQADHLIVIGRDMREVLLYKTGRLSNCDNISLVPNWSVPCKNIQNDNKTNSLIRKEFGDKIILQYSGNIGRVQGIEVIIDAFAQTVNPDIHLLIRGTGAHFSVIHNIVKSKDLKNVTLTGAYSRNEEMDILMDCDISIVSLARGMYGLGVPSKAYNILSAGKPILFVGDPDSEISLMVKENNNGWAFDIDKKQELIVFFNNLKVEYKQNYQNMGLKSRLLAENQYEEKAVLTLFQRQMEKYF